MIAPSRSQSLQAVLLDLDLLAGELGDASVQQSIQELSEQLARGRMRLAVIGPVGAGKSSLINALLWRPLLPEGRLGTTGRVVPVTTGERSAALEGLRADGARAPLSEAQFQNACLGAGRWASVGATVLPAEPLPVPITLVDTPGLDMSDSAEPTPVQTELEKADGLILVFDYRSDLPLTWLKRLSGEMRGKALLWVINFCPSPLPDQRTAALEQQLVQFFGRPVQTLRVMAHTAGFPAAPIRAALQALLAADSRVRLARKTLVWEALKVWQQLDLALAAQETAAASHREMAAATEGRIGQLESLRSQALDAVASWRKRVEEQLISLIAGRLVQTELDARPANLDLTISRLGAELRSSLRGLLDQAAAAAPLATAPPQAVEVKGRWTSDTFTDSTPPAKKYLVKLARDPASLKADLLHRYRTAADDMAEQLSERIGQHFDGLISMQDQKRHELAAAAQTSATRLGAMRMALQAAGEWLRWLGAQVDGGWMTG